MKFEITAAVAVAAVGAFAQSSESFSTLSATNSSISPMVVTMTIDDCESSSMPTMITVTNGVTITYCPECEMASSESAAMAATATIPHTTIYTTTYMSLCSTGSTWYTTPQEYTVTESCTEATPTWSSGADYVPQGFTTTEMMCSMCETPTAMTITMPCGCRETEGAGSPSGATASPTGAAGSGSSGPGGSAAPGGPAAPAGSAASSGIGSSAPSASAATGSGSSGSTAPYPVPAASSAATACPGPGCRAAQPSASPVSSGTAASPSQSLEAFTGAASNTKTSSWSFAGVALAVAVFGAAVVL